MKKIFLTLIFLGCNLLVLSQNSNTKSADYLFKKYEFTKAAEHYLKLATSDKSNEYITKKLADCYYYLSNTIEAEKWYSKTLENTTEKEAIFRYSQVLKLNGKVAEAIAQIEKFALLFPEDLRTLSYINKTDLSKIDDKKYSVKNLDLNSKFSDFGAFFINKKLYFASSRNNSNKKYSWNNEPFLDVFEASFSDDKTFSTPIQTPNINSKYNDGPATVTGDGKTIYFCTESSRTKDFENDKKNNLKLSKNYIYKATQNADKWENIAALAINSVEYSTSNPCISRDSKTLYFSSDRPGGFGGVDIWKVAINSDGTSGQPINLGNRINTESNESFPFISDDNNTLYFASNGKDGYGNYDVFSINLSANEKAQNLGKSVNTSFDDFGFCYNETEKVGFLSSNRNGNDDLFLVETNCSQQTNILVSNSKTGEIIPNADLTVLDENKNIIIYDKTNDKGELSIINDCGKVYSIIVSKQGFEKKSTNLVTDSKPIRNIDIKIISIDVIITEKEVILKPIYFELRKWNITSQGSEELDKLVNVMMENPEMKIFIKSHTDNRDTDKNNLLLSEKRAKSTVDYIISQGIDSNRISGKGCGESELKINCTNCTEDEHSQNRRSEFLIIK